MGLPCGSTRYLKPPAPRGDGFEEASRRCRGLQGIPMNEVSAYFLTWTTYGTWLPGDSRGWVNRHRRHGEIVDPPSPVLESYARGLLKESPILLTPMMRRAVATAIQKTCSEFGWELHALEVRSNHVHVVISAHNISTGKAIGLLKVRSRRALEVTVSGVRRQRWWTKDGSKRILKSQPSLDAAIQYVINQERSPGGAVGFKTFP